MTDAEAPGIAPRPQLLSYPDSLGGDLRTLGDVLAGPLAGCFRGVHILPPFPSSGDRGFAPLTYEEIEPRFGTWADIERIAAGHDVLLDLMINHVSRRSPQFQAFLRDGRDAPDADLFLTLDKVWPDGQPAAEDLARIFLRKPEAPFTTVTIERTGARETVWTTFGTADWSEQIDLDVSSPSTRRLIQTWLRGFASHGVRIVRLDAVGYVVKRAGTSCFMVEPEIWTFLDWVTDLASSMGLVVLPEVHDVPETHGRLAARGHWTYDFVLPGLVLHALSTGDIGRLASHLATSPARQVTTLDCHDGIPVRPDLDGVLEPAEMVTLADRIVALGGNVNRILSAAHGVGVDVHQLNCTYYSALGSDDERYVAARALQLFAPGVPQVYYVGLLAGENDHDAVLATGEGRAINRHDYTRDEVEAALRRPLVRRVLDLVRLRNTHPAFDGELRVGGDRAGRLELAWQGRGAAVRLELDLSAGRATVIEDGRAELLAEWGRDPRPEVAPV